MPLPVRPVRGDVPGGGGRQILPLLGPPPRMDLARYLSLRSGNQQYILLLYVYNILYSIYIILYMENYVFR